MQPPAQPRRRSSPRSFHVGSWRGAGAAQVCLDYRPSTTRLSSRTTPRSPPPRVFTEPAAASRPRRTLGNAGGNGCDTTSRSATPCTDMPVQSFTTNQHWQSWAVLKQIRSLMLMFCRNILLLWNILPYNELFACKASRASVDSFFLAKQISTYW